jgi:hypothetical protein
VCSGRVEQLVQTGRVHVLVGVLAGEEPAVAGSPEDGRMMISGGQFAEEAGQGCGHIDGPDSDS